MCRRDVATKRQKPCLDPLNQIRTSRTHIQILTRRKEGVPKCFAILTAVKIQFKATLVGPPGAGDDHILPLKIYCLVSEKTRADDVVTKYAGHQFISLGSLDRQWRNIRLEHLDIKMGGCREALAVQQHVGISKRQPKAILMQPYRYRVVHHSARCIYHRHVIALIILHAGHITWRCHLYQTKCIWSYNLNLTFDGNIPDLNCRLQVLTVLFRRGKKRREQHMVIHRIGLNACRVNTTRERCFSYTDRGCQVRHGHGFRPIRNFLAAE